MSNFYKKISNHKKLGPGGINCICCGPAPGKTRKQFIRNGKKRLKRQTQKEIKQIISEGD